MTQWMFCMTDSNCGGLSCKWTQVTSSQANPRDSDMGGLVSDMGAVHNSPVFEKEWRHVSTFDRQKSSDGQQISRFRYQASLLNSPGTMQGCLVLTSVGKYGGNPINCADLEEISCPPEVKLLNNPNCSEVPTLFIYCPRATLGSYIGSLLRGA
jgi:hypothetical protein